MASPSEEAVFLARHWSTVQELIEAVAQVRQEMVSLLHSLEEELARLEWWHDGWLLERYKDDQVFISNSRWTYMDAGETGHLVMIGVERFAPENLFGEEPPPQLYLWAPPSRTDLTQALADQIQGGLYERIGSLRRYAGGYVVTDELQRTSPEDAERFWDRARGQILRFFSHYAAITMSLDPLIRKHQRLGG